MISTPEISLIASADFQSFNVTLFTAVVRCVLLYSLSITENGGQLTTLTIGSRGTGSIGSINRGKNTYIISAFAVTEVMNSSSSGSVAGWDDFSDI